MLYRIPLVMSEKGLGLSNVISIIENKIYENGLNAFEKYLFIFNPRVTY